MKIKNVRKNFGEKKLTIYIINLYKSLQTEEKYE